MGKSGFPILSPCGTSQHRRMCHAPEPCSRGASGGRMQRLSSYPTGRGWAAQRPPVAGAEPAVASHSGDCPCPAQERGGLLRPDACVCRRLGYNRGMDAPRPVFTSARAPVLASYLVAVFASVVALVATNLLAPLVGQWGFALFFACGDGERLVWWVRAGVAGHGALGACKRPCTASVLAVIQADGCGGCTSGRVPLCGGGHQHAQRGAPAFRELRPG